MGEDHHGLVGESHGALAFLPWASVSLFMYIKIYMVCWL